MKTNTSSSSSSSSSSFSLPTCLPPPEYGHKKKTRGSAGQKGRENNLSALPSLNLMYVGWLAWEGRKLKMKSVFHDLALLHDLVHGS